MATEIVRNPEIPYVGAVEEGLVPRKMVRIRGQVPTDAVRFAVNYQLGPGLNPRDDIAIHISPRFPEGVIRRNHIESMSWGANEDEGLMVIQPGQEFEMIVLCDHTSYKIAVNNRHFAEFAHRLPYEEVTHLVIDGDVEVSSIIYENVPVGAIPQSPMSLQNVRPVNYGPPRGLYPSLDTTVTAAMEYANRKREEGYEKTDASKNETKSESGSGFSRRPLATSLAASAIQRNLFAQQGYPSQEPNTGNEGGVFGSILGALGGSGAQQPAYSTPPPSNNNPLSEAMRSLFGGVLAPYGEGNEDTSLEYGPLLTGFSSTDTPVDAAMKKRALVDCFKAVGAVTVARGMSAAIGYAFRKSEEKTDASKNGSVFSSTLRTLATGFVASTITRQLFAQEDYASQEPNTGNEGGVFGSILGALGGSGAQQPAYSAPRDNYSSNYVTPNTPMPSAHTENSPTSGGHKLTADEISKGLGLDD